jgi:hypothetical protein
VIKVNTIDIRNRGKKEEEKGRRKQGRCKNKRKE